MAQRYAAILSLVGMSVVLLEAAKRGGGLESTIGAALLWMLIMGAIGWLAGAIALWTVEEAVRQSMELELAAAEGPPGS